MTSHNTGNEFSNPSIFFSPKWLRGHGGKKEENVSEVGVLKQALKSMNMLFIRRREGKGGHQFCLPTGFYDRRGGNAKGSRGLGGFKQGCFQLEGSINVQCSAILMLWI